MKKIVILLVCLLAASSLFAVDITVGGALGFSHSWMSGSDWDDMLKDEDLSNEFRLGFEIGGFADIAINKMFSVQPELNFLYMRVGGGGIENLGIKTEYGITYSTKVLEIPVLAKFNFAAGHGKLSAFLGPAVQFILGDIATDVTMSVSGISISLPGNSLEPDNSVIFAGVVGAGYAMPIGPGSLCFDLRYRRQFNGLFDNINYRLNTIGLRVGYGIGLKLK